MRRRRASARISKVSQNKAPKKLSKSELPSSLRDFRGKRRYGENSVPNEPSVKKNLNDATSKQDPRRGKTFGDDTSSGTNLTGSVSSNENFQGGSNSKRFQGGSNSKRFQGKLSSMQNFGEISSPRQYFDGPSSSMQNFQTNGQSVKNSEEKESSTGKCQSKNLDQEKVLPRNNVSFTQSMRNNQDALKPSLNFENYLISRNLGGSNAKSKHSFYNDFSKTTNNDPYPSSKNSHYSPMQNSIPDAVQPSNASRSILDTDLKIALSPKQHSEENLLKIQFSKIHRCTAKNIDEHVEELELKIPPTQDNSLYNALKSALKSFKDKYSIQNLLIEYITQEPMWRRYCHHVYLQHQNSLKDLRPLDLSQNNLEIHSKAKAVYTRHFEKSSGSILELILASARFDLNAVLIQYMEDEEEFHVFDICPQNKKKAVFLNVGPSHNGKWRYVEPKGKIPVGNYSLVVALPEKTVLTIRKKEVDFLPDQAKIPECDLQLFNRLLSRAARLEEFTFSIGNISNHILAWEDDIDAEKTPQDSVEFLLQPQKTPPPSSYAFKSLETLQDCSDWCRNLTKNPEPKGIIGTDAIPISNLPLFQKVTFPRLHPEVNTQGMTSRGPPLNSLGVISPKTSSEFTSIDADGKISVRILQNEDFGAPQILLRLETGAQLTQEAAHELFLRPLHFPIELSLFESENSTFNASRLLTSEFRIPGGSIFSLKNPNDCPASIRCAWFT